MFTKPSFGANTSTFGMSSTFGASPSTSASPFGGFKPGAAAGAFGAPPAFGANTSAQPAAGGLFSSSNTSGGGLFGGGAAAAPAPAFGASSAFSFGANTSAGAGGLFANNASSGLFGNSQQNNAFGAKPAGFGFGGTTTNQPQNSGLFGNTSTTGSSLFGQQNTTLGGGLFSNTAGGFGQQAASGSGHVKYSPVVGSDVVVKGGASQNISVKHHCITCMKEYESKSLEELRMEDYAAGRKGNSGGGMFPFQQQQQGAKPLFGTSTSFGSVATTSAPSVFGGLGSGGGFGQTNSSFAFGGLTQASTNPTGLFGGSKPFGSTAATGTGLFGAAATTQAPAFGTSAAPTFGFGTSLQNQTTGGGIFGAKPATSVFGAPAASSGFGAFGGGGLFGAKPTQTQAPTFGNTQPGLGTQALGFGTNTSTSGSLFGGGFGKPATTQPAFGFGTTQPTLGLGGNAFQAKPATAPFGQLGSTNMFQNPASNTFRTGLDGGLGGGLFNTSGLGGSALGGLGMNANNTMLANNLSGSSAAGNVHEQILTLAARPYGDSPLFKDLLPDTSATAEDVLRATNPAAMKAVLDRSASAYRVTSPAGIRLQLQPKTAPAHHKKSLFDGLEEYDASLEDKLSLKPSRKRLVLRHNNNNSHTTSYNNRSQEDQTQPSSDEFAPTQNERETQIYGEIIEKETAIGGELVEKETAPVAAARQTETAVERVKRNIQFENNNDVISDRQGSWLNASKMQWSEKEKSIDGQQTPQIYPNLDKELPSDESDRRASWLTTKPLRKPLVSAPPSAENSIRELGLRPASPASHENKENVLTVSEELVEYVEPRERPPHPAGVKLTRTGYYTIPTLDEMVAYMRPDGSCVVPHLTIGRTNYGNVHYDSEVNVTGLDLDALVHFMNKEVIVYPEDGDKPPVGEGLNKRAIVTLDRVWPRDKTENRPITDPDRLWEFERKLRRVCDKHKTKFVEYRPQTGSWVFRVDHFSKYGLTDSDEEEELTPDVMKRQLAHNALQNSAAPAMKPVPTSSAGLGGLGGPSMPSPGLGGLGGPSMPSPGLGGLGGPSMPSPGLGGPNMPSLGLGGLGGLGVTSPGAGVAADSIFAMQQASLNLFNGSRAFEMDTTEDNGESQSLYQENRAFGVKSPTSELARLEHRQSHHVQLMKASLYADTEMEDDVSMSTGDQLVPMSAPLPAPEDVSPPRAAPADDDDDGASVRAAAHDTQEVQMSPLIVKPHTIVLKYHRKVPPFKHTIAGRLDASCISELSVSRARHSRVGFGARGNIAFATSYDSIVDLPKTAELSELWRYTRGRGARDWSEAVVARLALLHPHPHPHHRHHVQEILGRQLETLFQYSEFVEPPSEHVSPRLRLRDSPRERRATLQRLLRDAAITKDSKPKFGVSGAYCYQVWKLCDALWGADLENDGVPGTDDLSIVNRHKRFLEWMKDAVDKITDEELAVPTAGEPEDASDGHSARVWTLLLGGRALDACRLARARGDLNLAAIIAQAAGEPAFRSLIARQLSMWRECGADGVISRHKRAVMLLAAGEPPLLDLARAKWMHALHATARYLCPQVPSLEQIVRKYEGFFSTGVVEDPLAFDLTTTDGDEMGMQLPLPPYAENYDVVITQGGKQRRVLDLRYELIRARAFNTRPAPRPAAYSRDPLDHSLSFVLGVWFGSPSGRDAAAAADQLEAAGAWHLAVHALAYHPDDVTRSHLIRNVISRHAPATADTPEQKAQLALVRKLRVPEKWLLLAQAHRAKYENLPAVEAEHLASAQQWNAAHKVFLDKLLPPAVLGDTLQQHGGLLGRLAAAAAASELSGWAAGGLAAYSYLHVCDEVRGLVAPAAGAAPGARLEALRPALAAACRALAALRPTSAGGAAARGEMGARLVQLAAAAGEPPARLAALLRALALPPDCAHYAQHKITMDLAEQASELCIESASSSPISSHHRATAAS